MVLSTVFAKMDQFGRGSWVHLLAVSGPFCPFWLVSEFLHVRPQGSQLFLHADGSPLTRFQCLSVSGATPFR